MVNCDEKWKAVQHNCKHVKIQRLGGGWPASCGENLLQCMHYVYNVYISIFFYIYRLGLILLNTELKSVKRKMHLFISTQSSSGIFTTRDTSGTFSRVFFFPTFLVPLKKENVRLCRDSCASSALLRGRRRSLCVSFEVALNSNLKIRKVYWPLHKTGLHNEACFCSSPSRIARTLQEDNE